MSRSKVLLAVAAVALATVPANAVTIVNGSFELGTDPGGFTTEFPGSTAIAGWTVGGSNGVDYVGSYWEASEGVRSIDLSGAGTGGSVSQQLDTVVGNSYTVTFDLSGNPDAGPDTKVAVVSISGSTPTILTYDVLATNSRADMNWQSYSYTFTAFATTSQLTFASAEPSAFGPALDNVGIIDNGGGTGADVPEPATWAMLMLGFSMIGVSVRRRRPRPVAA